MTRRGWAVLVVVSFLVGAFAPWDRLPWGVR